MKLHKEIATLFVMLLSSATLVSEEAQAIDMSGLQAKLPGTEGLEDLESKMQAEPGNLDHYFAYAQMATKLREYDKAAYAYERMLVMDPTLDRVKLDLGMTYAAMGKHAEAEVMLKEVLDRRIPDQVRYNVEQALAQIQGATQQHYFDGSLALGFYHDSNGNSATSTGRITVFDTDLELSANDREQEDFQVFGAATLNHRYRLLEPLSDGVNMNWLSSLSAYQSEQEHLDNLNLQLVSVNTGPSFTFNKLGLKSDVKAGYTHISLAQHTYLKIYSLEADNQYVLNKDWRLQGKLKTEYRNFENSPTVSTYEERSGGAYEATIGASYALTQHDILSAALKLRHEDAQERYFDNNQWHLSGNYTHVWDDGIFSNVTLGFKGTLYEEAEEFISSRKRHEHEWSAGVNNGFALNDHVSLLLGYQYRKVDSNIQNYNYDNHRISTVISVKY